MFNKILAVVEKSAIASGFKWDSIAESKMAANKLAAAYCALSDAMVESDIPRKEQRRILEGIRESYEIPQCAFIETPGRWLMKPEIAEVAEIVAAYSI